MSSRGIISDIGLCGDMVCLGVELDEVHTDQYVIMMVMKKLDHEDYERLMHHMIAGQGCLIYTEFVPTGYLYVVWEHCSFMERWTCF